ncbi:hypothetical protein [Halalkalicoccus subterraneus]|uniref:hypothetical protein n=1 Tax=Halalkalicoccus subterraneus TaxID=2675002 RepID=UPI000EFAFCA2|nr:hypothetical protein [Halalkalicoccus subterraneus]
MDSITLRLQPDTIESLSGEANEHGVSRSEYVRNIIQSRHELERLRGEYERLQADHEGEIEELREEYEDRIADLERENERLRNEKRALIQDREERTDLVEYVEREKELDQQRQQRRQAPAWRRAKWWLLGEPDDR